jgi:hypothetical protein
MWQAISPLERIATFPGSITTNEDEPLCRGADLWRKRAARDVLTLRAAHRLHLMFGHDQLQRRQILDLTALDHLAVHLLQWALAGETVNGNFEMAHPHS